MKKTYTFILFTFILFGCSKKNSINNCNYLLNIGVNVSINMNLPQYNQLQFVNSPVYISNVGNGGIYVINRGSDYAAWDASDPNHAPSSCSIMTRNGIHLTCNCGDENTYELFTGSPVEETNVRCGLKPYNVEQSGNSLLIYN